MSTIVAISTAMASGGIGIIRMSGEESLNILQKIFKPKQNEEKEEIRGYTIKYGYIFDEEKVIDEVLVSFFKSPKSYTTEDMCEINSHGGIVVTRRILELCIKNGAKLAEPGEFTKRAFINGRIDLSQAEAVSDMISAKSNKELEEATKQLKGELSNIITKTKNDLMSLMVNIEASIDYPEYDVEDVSYTNAIKDLKEVKQEIQLLVNSFENGKIIKNGVKLAIIGSPNAGKSSLLNELLKEERAIVTEYAGTTRDTIEESILIEGIPFKIVDTAGIRKSDNQIEQIGIEKSKKVANESDVILAVFDNSKKLNEEDKEILKFIKDKKAIILINKTDLNSEDLENADEIKELKKSIIKMSLLKKTGIEQLYKELINMFNLNQLVLDDAYVITNVRHKTLINNSIDNIEDAIKNLENKLPIDIIAINIKEALDNLGEILGENISEDIIKEIFSKFCLGK